MTTISKWLVALALLTGSMTGNAEMVDGTFSGELYAGQGTQNGVDITSLLGQSLTGTFSFDSEALPLTSGSSGTYYSNTFQVMNPSIPLIISVAVGGNTFTVDGTFYSTLTTSDGPVSTFFSAAAQTLSDQVALVVGIRRIACRRCIDVISELIPSEILGMAFCDLWQHGGIPLVPISY